MAAVPVIGRDAERDAIGSWLGGTKSGALLIEGVAGIGKTTLWSDTVDRAAAAGRRVTSWRASRAEQDIAFAVLTALVDTPPFAAALAHLAEPRRHALEVALGRADPEQRSPDPSLIGLGLADVLRRTAAGAPVLVAVDDIQWIDRASDGVLCFAARRLATDPVAFVLARRTGELAGARPAASEPALATASDQRERIEVGPLTVGAFGRLIHQRLGVAHPRPLLLRIHAACAGNSFLGLEISRSLSARAAAPGQGEPFPVPPEAGPLVRDHLAALGPGAVRAVVAVAMSPDPRLSLVERVLGEGGGAAVDEACAAGVLVADGDRLYAAHPLFTSTAYAHAPPGERRALRRRLADLVDDPVERAVHLASTVDGPDPAVADALATAGRLALARGAPGTAAELLERASDAALAADLRASLRVESAEAAAAAGDPRRGEAALREALALVPTGRVRAAALLALGDIVYVERPADAAPLLLAALDHTEGDPVLEATVHSYIAGMADLDPAAANRGAEQAARILERPDVHPDPEHLACALLERAFHCLLRGEPADPADLERGLRLRTGGGSPFIARRAQELAERCLFHLGRLGEARALDEAEHRRLTERGEYGLLPPLSQALSVLTQMGGDWDAARRYAAECVDLVAQGAEAWRERSVLAAGRVHAWDGDLDAARSVAVPALALQEEAGDRWEAGIFCALLGFVELSAPDPHAALRYLTRALDHADAIEVRLPTQFRFLGDLVEAAVLAGDLGYAERILTQRLEAAARRQPLPWTAAMAHRGRGLLAMANGDLATAVAALDSAVAVYDTTLPMPFERARTRYVRGQARRRSGHRRAARDDLGAASCTFTELGARAWVRLAAVEAARIGGRVPTGRELTASERAVAVHAAAGRSNKEIAAGLMISPRTVESQLSAVYRKLDIRSRGQLAAALDTDPGAPGGG